MKLGNLLRAFVLIGFYTYGAVCFVLYHKGTVLTQTQEFIAILWLFATAIIIIVVALALLSLLIEWLNQFEI